NIILELDSNQSPGRGYFTPCRCVTHTFPRGPLTHAERERLGRITDLLLEGRSRNRSSRRPPGVRSLSRGCRVSLAPVAAVWRLRAGLLGPGELARQWPLIADVMCHAELGMYRPAYSRRRARTRPSSRSIPVPSSEGHQVWVRDKEGARCSSGCR